MIRKAEKKDLARIAEIQVFNYRMYFYPIFKSDEYYFDELQVPSLMKNYETELDSLYVYDDGVVKGFIKVEDTYIARLFVEPVLQNAGILFCGDAAMNNFPSIHRVIIWIENLVQFKESWKTILNAAPKTIYPSHGKPFPTTDLKKFIFGLDKIKLRPLEIL